jgi:hypothetical protein
MLTNFNKPDFEVATSQEAKLRSTDTSKAKRRAVVVKHMGISVLSFIYGYKFLSTSRQRKKKKGKKTDLAKFICSVQKRCCVVLEIYYYNLKRFLTIVEQTRKRVEI